jgi:hypothetical protein
MLKKIGIIIGCWILLLAGALLATLFIENPSEQASAAGRGFQTMVAVASLPVDCGVGVSIEDTFTKVFEIGVFVVSNADSLVEMTYDGRVNANSTTTSGVVFELRVDDTASSIGRVRTVIKKSETGFDGVPVSFTGAFSGLTAGQHTVSMWARAPFGTANFVELDPGCWGTDKVLVIEHFPFGANYLPAVSRK